MGILLVLVPWGYGKWRVQFYKYTIEYIIEIKKTKTDVQEDNIGLKGGVPPPQIWTEYTLQTSIYIVVLVWSWFRLCSLFLHLNFISCILKISHHSNSAEAIAKTIFFWICPHIKLMDVFFLLVYLIVLNTIPQFLLDHIPLCL